MFNVERKERLSSLHFEKCLYCIFFFIQKAYIDRRALFSLHNDKKKTKNFFLVLFLKGRLQR